MITAHSDDVKLPPGRYQVSTILRSLGKCRTMSKCANSNPNKSKRVVIPKPHKRTRPYRKTRRDREVERYLLDAAIEDPDELQEFWNRFEMVE